MFLLLRREINSFLELHDIVSLIIIHMKNIMIDIRIFSRSVIFLCFVVYILQHVEDVQSKKKAKEIDYESSTILLKGMDHVFELLNRMIADMEWQTLRNRSIIPLEIYVFFVQLKLKWKNLWCVKLKNFWYNDISLNKKLLHFLCNGPRYTNDMTKKITIINEHLSSIYNSAQICKIDNFKQKCYNGEVDVMKLMATSRNEKELRWAWTAWRNHMSNTKEFFKRLIDFQNVAARRNGYTDIGEYWREEFDIPNLEDVFEEMYKRVESLYRLLHAVVRFRLAKLYPDIVDVFLPIPAHLLGSLWSQSWEALIDLIFPNHNTSNLTNSMKREHYNVTKMIEKTEDFYISLGFPPLTAEFWNNSVFQRDTNETYTCHATAVNMYKKNDFRLFACLETKLQDFNVIYHEIGHIQYYMAYQNQPFVFQNGINSAFHESIGDAISYGAVSFRHMQRLGLTSNEFTSSTNSHSQDSLEMIGLLKQALFKIPQLSSGLIIEKWRWSAFSGKMKPSRYNASWWNLHRRYMGIVPPSPRSEEFFDPAAKFHIVHNIPYGGYFLGNFLQVQLFQGMCEASLGLRLGSVAFNSSLHKCDIYGSKDAGKFLRSIMELGNNVDWRYALRTITGYSEYRVEPFLAYYEPVRQWLQREIEHHRIPVGWN